MKLKHSFSATPHLYTVQPPPPPDIRNGTENTAPPCPRCSYCRISPSPSHRFIFPTFSKDFSRPCHRIFIHAMPHPAQPRGLPVHPTLAPLVHRASSPRHFLPAVGVVGRECADFTYLDCTTHPILQRVFCGLIRQVAQLLFPADSEGLLASFHTTFTSESRMRTAMMKCLKASARGSAEWSFLRGCLCLSFRIAMVADMLNGDEEEGSDGTQSCSNVN